MKRKMKAQGSIELMIIAPVMIFFISGSFSSLKEILSGFRLGT